MTRHAEVAASADGAEGDSRARRSSPAASATGRCATWARSAARSPTTIRRPDYPAAVLGLGATITTNKRKIAADEFFKGMFETALEPGELITAVSFPAPKRAAYMKFKNPASRFALVGVFVARDRRRRARRRSPAAAPACSAQSGMEEALAQKFTPDRVAASRSKPTA